MAAAPVVPFVTSVFHATDFSEASDRAFAHALAVALLRQASFVIFHTGGDLDESWQRFPRVRETLERWGLLEPASPRSAVFDRLKVRVTKVQEKGRAGRAALEEVARDEPDLLVLATEGRDGLAGWLRPSVAERIARRSRTMTLFVPADGHGFVDLETGHLSLRRILVPVDEKPDPRAAIVRATRAAEALGDGGVQITLLRVNAEPPAPLVPEGEAFRFESRRVDGDVVEKIVEAAGSADLVVMPTEGRDGVLDLLRGSVTERVLRVAPCPVLAVPAE